MEKKMQDAINRQINAELWSAYLYLAMSLYAESKGLKGVGHWMYVQWKEELDHARILQEYMLSMDAPVILQPIENVPSTWDSVHTMFKDVLVHEQQVTYMINRLMKTAMAIEDYATMVRLEWFIEEQVEEEESVREIIASLDLIDGDTVALFAFNNTLLCREYTKPKALRS